MIYEFDFNSNNSGSLILIIYKGVDIINLIFYDFSFNLSRDFILFLK